MRCLACNAIIPDHHVNIYIDLCKTCFNISMDAVRELEVEDLKENTKNGSEPSA